MQKKGFSLIELVVTMAIMGILVGVVAPTFVGYQEKRKLKFSRDLLETALQRSFSEARSKPRIFGVKGIVGAQGYIRFSCGVSAGMRCDEENGPEYSKRDLSYERGIKNKTSFEILFLPPHGDIDTDNSRINNTPLYGQYDEILTLQNIKTEEEEQSIRIYPKSGLIEKQ